jgi:RNA polymerase-binding transcription factor DksA
MNCQTCGKEIPEERLAILPNTRVCVACSTEKPKKGVMVCHKKMASELVTMDSDIADDFKRMQSKSFLR